MSVLVIVEHNNRALNPATLHAVTAAVALGGEIHLLIIGHACAEVAQQAAQIAGVAKVFLSEAAHYAEALPENVSERVTQFVLAGTYSHLLATATSFGKSFMPRVAALLDVAQISEIVGIESPDTFVRPIYAGSVLASVRSADRIKVITLRSTAFAAAEEKGGTASIETLAPLPDFGKSRFVARELNASSRPELSSAKIVVAGGRGLGSAENYQKILEPLADTLGAALGASRAAVDAAYAPNDFQVGQTGKIIAPELYIAVGISGAIQHLAGMKDSRVIVAINKDPEAAIFQAADYGIVGDLFTVVPELSKALGA